MKGFRAPSTNNDQRGFQAAKISGKKGKLKKRKKKKRKKKTIIPSFFLRPSSLFSNLPLFPISS